jgi:hypothetical protein
VSDDLTSTSPVTLPISCVSASENVSRLKPVSVSVGINYLLSVEWSTLKPRRHAQHRQAFSAVCGLEVMTPIPDRRSGW